MQRLLFDLEYPVDPLTALILGTAYLGKEAVADAAKRILGPSWDLVGERLKLKLFGPSAGPVLAGAAVMTVEAEYVPEAVPGRILLPLLSHASLEQDNELRVKWSALLANAAKPIEGYRILPGYVDTLRQLTPRQAVIIDWMFRQRHQLGPAVDDELHPRLPRAKLEANLSLSKEDFALLITDLDRMKLLRPAGQQLRDAWQEEVYREVQFTAFGLRFIEACQTPVASKTVSAPGESAPNATADQSL